MASLSEKSSCQGALQVRMLQGMQLPLAAAGIVFSPCGVQYSKTRSFTLFRGRRSLLKSPAAIALRPATTDATQAGASLKYVNQYASTRFVRITGCVKVMPTISQLVRKPREVSRESSK